MATNLAEKYSTQVDEVIRRGLLSTAGTNNDVEFGNAQTVKVYSLDTAPLNDYDPTAGMSRYGTPVELEDTVQEMKMSQQKSFTFTIDKTFESDSPEGVRSAGKALQRLRHRRMSRLRRLHRRLQMIQRIVVSILYEFQFFYL